MLAKLLIIATLSFSAIAQAKEPSPYTLEQAKKHPSEVAKMLSDTLAKSAPSRIDGITILLSSLYTPDIKTIHVSYELTDDYQSQVLKLIGDNYREVKNLQGVKNDLQTGRFSLRLLLENWLIMRNCSDTLINTLILNGVTISHRYEHLGKVHTTIAVNEYSCNNQDAIINRNYTNFIRPYKTVWRKADPSEVDVSGFK